jgi:copper chaperone CopZ
MKQMTCVLTPVLALVLASTASAGKVEIKGVHLCCGQCLKGVDSALKDVAGVSAVKSDGKAGTVTFDAADDKTAEAGIKALAEGGFHGAAKHGDRELAFPASGAKKGAKANSVTVGSVHLCCPACVRAVDKAVKSVGGVSEVKSDRGASSVTVNGTDVSVEAVIKALNDAGFHATVKE